MAQALSRDTSEEAERLYLASLRRISVAARLHSIGDMITTAQLLMRAGVRRRHPDLQQAQEEEHRRFLSLWFGCTLAPQVAAAYHEALSRYTEDSPMPTALDVLLQVIEALDALHIPYLLGGSWASMAHGVPRATQDADLLVQLKPSSADALVSALQGSFYISPDAVHDAISRGASFNVIPLGVVFKVDIFVAPDQPYEKMEMSRRIPYEITHDPRRAVYVATPEDSILTKLRWYRQGGHVSEQQWKDVLGVLKVQADALDMHYLHHWAGVLGLDDLLARALTVVASR